MKALSIQQPWAWAILYLGKDIENRDWRYPPKFRGKFFIHTGKKIDKEGYEYISDTMRFGLPRIGDLQTGGIVGSAEITSCVTHSNSPWFFGPQGLVIANAKYIDFIPMLGKLGFFETGITESEIINSRLPPDVKKVFEKLDSGVYDKINKPLKIEQLDLFGETT
jgi:hypothetical protein